MTTTNQASQSNQAPMCSHCKASINPTNPLANGWKIKKLADAAGADAGAILEVPAYDYGAQEWTTADHAHFHCASGAMLYCGALLASCRPQSAS